MNEMIKRQLDHRTIREFTDEPVDKKDLLDILQVANRTATSTGMQGYSIIRVTDKSKREEISKVCNQEYLKRVPELFIFVVDLFRNSRIAREQGHELASEGDMDRFFQGFSDAMLAAQNSTNAIESKGMGVVFFGSILNDPDEIVRILNLPKLTFPAVGLGFGYPNQEPQLKPRMELDLKVFENEYKVFDNYLEEIAEYDKVMNQYYDLRDANRRVDTFSLQVVKRLEGVMEKRSKILNSIRRQGFDLQVE